MTGGRARGSPAAGGRAGGRSAAWWRRNRGDAAASQRKVRDDGMEQPLGWAAVARVRAAAGRQTHSYPAPQTSTVVDDAPGRHSDSSLVGPTAAGQCRTSTGFPRSGWWNVRTSRHGPRPVKPVRTLGSTRMKWRAIMTWTWQNASGAPLDGTRPSPAHGSQADAESWLGENWRELGEAGVAQVTLLDWARRCTARCHCPSSRAATGRRERPLPSAAARPRCAACGAAPGRCRRSRCR